MVTTGVSNTWPAVLFEKFQIIKNFRHLVYSLVLITHDLPKTQDNIRRKQDVKLYLVRFRYRYCCVSVIIRPSDYSICPHLALGTI